MGTATLIPVEEYLSTDYEPDCDYVDGVLEERNEGETPHASLQALLTAGLISRRKALGIWVTTEQRVRISSTRYRVPDICVVLGSRPDERVFTQRAWIHSHTQALREVTDGTLRAGPIEVPIADLFED